MVGTRKPTPENQKPPLEDPRRSQGMTYLSDLLCRQETAHSQTINPNSILHSAASIFSKQERENDTNLVSSQHITDAISILGLPPQARSWRDKELLNTEMQMSISVNALSSLSLSFIVFPVNPSWSRCESCSGF